MNKAELAQVEKLQEQIVALAPGQIEVLQAWAISSYDVRGNWVQYTQDVPGFEFLRKRGK